LVIGAAGYMGRRIMALLRADGVEAIGADIEADPENVDINLDIRFPDSVYGLMARIRPVVVINMAYLLTEATAESPDDAVRTNVVGVSAVFGAAAAVGSRRVIFASSISVYGDQSALGEQWVDETTQVRPHTTYAWMKTLDEALAEQYQASSETQFVTVRSSSCYGYRRPGNRFNPIGVLLAAHGTSDSVMFPWRRSHRASLIHVDDAATMFVRLALAAHPRWPVYNTGGDSVTMAELADLAQPILRLRVEWKEPARDLRHAGRVSGDRLLGEFGVTRRPLADGLQQEATRLGLGTA
jgi:nucleoside-diphosphate-sugar epimerase